jgi:predicted nucleotidyltransferase
LRRSVDAFAEQLLSAHPEIEEIVVFGSFAKGTYAPGSDVDIFILLSHSDKRIRDRIPDYLPGPFPVGVDLFPYTKQEVRDLADSPVVADVHASEWRYRRRSSR